MKDLYDTHFDTLNKLFEDQLLSTYQKCKRKGKTKVLKYVSSLYRRWYYSALIDDTILSPANLFQMLNKENGKDISTALSVHAIGRSSIRFQTQSYTLENHPIVSDLRVFVESCQPDIDLTDEDTVTEQHLSAILDKLSIRDPFYANYLLLLAIHLNLLKKIPSIYSNRAQITHEYDKLYQLPSDKIFKKIVETTILIATLYIGEMFPIHTSPFDNGYIREMLVNPLSTDEIFKHVYFHMGIMVEDVWKLEESEGNDEINNAIMTSTFLLGIMLDKYFFTLFGYYLKLIHPLYLIPFDFENEFTYVLDSMHEIDGLITSLFAPCSNYYLTDIGLAFFHVKKTPENHLSLKSKVNFDLLMMLIDSKVSASNQEYEEIKAYYKKEHEQSQQIYEVKVKLGEMKSYWKNIEIPSNATLHSLFLEVCYIFNFDAEADYSFFTDTTENQFSEYTSRKNPRRAKKTDAVSLDQLNFREKHKFLLSLYDTFNPYLFELFYNSKIIRVELEIMKIKERQAGTFYPKVTKESRAFKDLEVDLEF